MKNSCRASYWRATYSESQLQEVMTDFWFNHFNVFIGKAATGLLVTSYERDVIRPHAMGKFEDLLLATAKSPAMMFYLDNWLSVGPNSDVATALASTWNKGADRKRARQNGPVKQAKGKRNGLNENYGRELMELHTLGVNGGYTQKDVTEVARVLTGWTIKQPKEAPPFNSMSACTSPETKSFSGITSKRMGRRKALRCCTFWRTIRLRPSFLHQAGDAFRFGQSAAAARGSHDANLLKERRRHSRSIENHAAVTGVLVDRYLSRQGENAFGVCGFSPAGERGGRDRCHDSGAATAKPGHAAVWHAATDGLFDEGGRLGKFVRAAGTDEFCTGFDSGKLKGVQVDPEHAFQHGRFAD